MKKKLFYLITILFVALGLGFSIMQLVRGNMRAGMLGLLTPLFMFIPLIINKLLGAKPYLLYIQGFLYAIIAFDIGYVAQMYAVIPHWDKIAHLYSGFLFTILGYCLFLLARRKNAHPEGLPKYIGPCFALGFSCFIAVFWEVCEFVDFHVTGNDGQQHLTTGVFDTMYDLILCLAGSVVCVVSVLLYLYRGWKLPSGAIAGEFLDIAKSKGGGADKEES